MATIIWDIGTSPTRYVSRTLGIAHWELRAAIHKIKAKSNLHAADSVIIYDDGTVTDSGGTEIGNIHDEL